MLLKAGAVSLALLVASRLLGLARESAQAAAFGASGLGDVAVLMLLLPDWLAGLLASGALAYVLLPHWAAQEPRAQAYTQRRVAYWLLAGGVLLGSVLWLLRVKAVAWLAPGVPLQLLPAAAQAIGWSALALPTALLAALWATRLQHARDFAGMYGANLVVNTVLVAALALLGAMASAAHSARASVLWLGAALAAAMALRLVWLAWRLARARGFAVQPSSAHSDGAAARAPTPVALPRVSLWLWAALSSGLPLALPFAARSLASQGGAGALATFNYAWKLVELPLVLAVQLVATLAFPAIAKSFAGPASQTPGVAATAEGVGVVRTALALAFSLACAAAAALLVGSGALAQLLFGWGRMDAQAVAQVARWGALGAWSLPAQAVLAVGITVLAAQARMARAAAVYAVALLAFLALAALVPGDGGQLMLLLGGVLWGAALAVLRALGTNARALLPLSSIAASGCALLLCAWVAPWLHASDFGQKMVPALMVSALAAIFVIATTALASPELRVRLKR